MVVGASQVGRGDERETAEHAVCGQSAQQGGTVRTEEALGDGSTMAGTERRCIQLHLSGKAHFDAFPA